jgi:Rhs element Vgr protein
MPNQDTIPGFTILKNGSEIPNASIFSVSIEFTVASIPKAVIQIDDGSWSQRKFGLSNGSDWRIGEKLEIKIGYSQQHELVFTGIIVKHTISASEGSGSRLVVELRHKYYLSSIKKLNRIFLEKSDSDCINEILSEYSFSAQVDDLSEKHRQMIQYYSSDWDFLNLRAEANQLLVFPKNDKIIFTKNIVEQSEKLNLGFGDNIAKINLEVDNRHAFEEFSVKSWNHEDQKIVQSDSSINLSKTIGDLSAIEIAENSKHKNKDITGFGTLSESEAEALANTNFQTAELIKVRGTIKCNGCGQIEIGDWVKLEGLSEPFNGKVFVTGVLHELSLGKWYTTFQIGLLPERYFQRFDNIVEAPALGLLPSVHGLQIGIVSKLESDNDDEKILVQLPNLLEGQDAVWARCARIDAGKDRGWVFRPEIGDEVILGFINDDPRQAIILGAMHSSKNPSEIKAADDNHHKGYVSREKLKFLFDDEKKIISILTPDATIVLDDDAKKLIVKNPDNEIELSPNGIKLESQKDIKIKSTGDIDIQGMNVKIKGDGQLEVEGSGGTKVSSSGITEIKGSMVKIN